MFMLKELVFVVVLNLLLLVHIYLVKHFVMFICLKFTCFAICLCMVFKRFYFT